MSNWWWKQIEWKNRLFGLKFKQLLFDWEEERERETFRIFNHNSINATVFLCLKFIQNRCMGSKLFIERTDEAVFFLFHSIKSGHMVNSTRFAYKVSLNALFIVWYFKWSYLFDASINISNGASFQFTLWMFISYLDKKIIAIFSNA